MQIRRGYCPHAPVRLAGEDLLLVIRGFGNSVKQLNEKGSAKYSLVTVWMASPCMFVVSLSSSWHPEL